MTGEQVVILHGGLTDDEQQTVVDNFKQASSPIRVLITGDLASEGVNLHAQCHELIHFDIPWSLIRIEQRNGRIDRYGQHHPPQITTLLLNPDAETFSGDLRVLSRLIEKEHEAHAALGDAASLMGKYDVGAEEDEIRKVLAGKTSLDAVVKDTRAVKAEDSVAGMLARLRASRRARSLGCRRRRRGVVLALPRAGRPSCGTRSRRRTRPRRPRSPRAGSAGATTARSGSSS